MADYKLGTPLAKTHTGAGQFCPSPRLSSRALGRRQSGRSRARSPSRTEIAAKSAPIGRGPHWQAVIVISRVGTTAQLTDPRACAYRESMEPKTCIRKLTISLAATGLFLAGCCTTGKLDNAGSGISVGDPETFDNTFFQTQLIALRGQLMSLQALDQTSLTKAIGGVQGGQLQQSGVNLQILGQATPQVATTLPATSTVVPSSADTRVSTQAALTPGIPSVAASTLTLPATIAGSTLDVLSEQMQLSSQVLNYEMLLSGSNYAKVGPSGDAKTELTIGFPITLEAPTAKHKDDIADVEVTYCYATPKDSPPAVVNLLPTDNTYNVLTLTDRSQSFGLGVIAGVFSVGGGYSGGTKTEYLIKQQDTVALRRSYDDTSDACRGGMNGIETAKTPRRGASAESGRTGVPQEAESYTGTTFAWQFRPVLGEHFVRSGIHQTFVQVAVPGQLDVSRTTINQTSTHSSATGASTTTNIASSSSSSTTGKPGASLRADNGTTTTDQDQDNLFAGYNFGSTKPYSYYYKVSDETVECANENQDISSDFTLDTQHITDTATTKAPSGFVVVKTRWIHLDPTNGVATSDASSSVKAIRLPVRGRVSDLPWLASCIKTRDLGGGNLWVRVGGVHIDGTRVRIGTSLIDSSTPGFKTFDNSVEFVAPAISIASGGAYLVAPSGRETSIYPRANQSKDSAVVGVPDETLTLNKVSVAPIDNASSLVELVITRSFKRHVPTMRPLVVLAAGKLYGLSDSPFVGQESAPSNGDPTSITLRLIAANTALNASPSVSVQRLFSGKPPTVAAILPPGSINVAPLPPSGGAGGISNGQKFCRAPGQCVLNGYLPNDGHLGVTAIGGCTPSLIAGIGTYRIVDMTHCSHTLQQLTFSTNDLAANFEQDLVISLAGDQPKTAAAGALAATVPMGSVAPHFALNRVVGNIQTNNGTALLTVSIQNLKDPTVTVTVTNADVSGVVDGTGKALTLTAIGQVTVAQDTTLTFQLANCCASKATVTAEGKNGTISTGKWAFDFSTVRESTPKLNEKNGK
jgi:hypothetical protein